MKAISLFSGAGGMDVGFKDAGFNVVAANEMDKHACETFKANHPNCKLIEGDIDICGEELFSLKDIDLVFGGPPCQGFSVAGKMDPDDPRSKLIFSFCSVVERVKPKAFVMENVKALGSLSKFEDVRTELLSRFQKAGYVTTIHILNSKDFGVPQARERVFFIGVRNEKKAVHKANFRKYLKTAPTLREVLIPLGKPGTERNDRICNAKITLAAKPILRKSPYAGMLFNGQGRPLNPDGWASTLPASMGGNRTPIIDDRHLYQGGNSWVEEYHRNLLKGCKPQGMHEAPSYLRRLTINEAALLQTFPEEYIWCGPNSKVYSQIGNAVPCELAKVVASCLMDILSGVTLSEKEHVEEGENMELAFV
ncbi:DNA (cytosine-5)-methyltransferase 1 [Oceanospirillum multiglobuliferum]|uniref:Cytosine-specific methyltransferase n=1 Tax=Oceanospirillum multiglobuliferum TaxID=64969 RepID=A0A1T4NL22_9GAMM|nr:DNA cytosine methyltransferase [Oceanospirillum multiglobuliferum]OPX55764.1 DNA (cytosine-5-)-methyltransferase [Oceanospirillum multiglobuliferum]SJZ79969.1 DNA (cytosine-5)-methyltransferase 1 [Oceanospirillum multiglobuliferum]